MAFAFRWLLRLTVGLLVVLFAAGALIYFFASRSLPDYDRTVEFSGIDAPVEIIRDNANVPHILGQNDRDVYFGLGFVHAQDRLWQMTMMRRTAQGRLSEVFGEQTLSIDTLMRRLDIYRLAQSSVAAQDAYAQEAMRAYAAGVNARLDQINREALGRGAPEMFLFNAPITPWVPADSLAIIKLMGVQLTGKIDDEVLRARTSLALTDQARLRDILPDTPGDGVIDLTDFASLFPDAPRGPRFAQTSHTEHALAPFPKRGLAGASNAWAASPERSAAGGTLLANDPHLGLTAPSTWYLARLELDTGGVIGGTIPGVPLVLTGRSERLGWGLTSAYVDDQDIYIEKLNPDDPGQYLTPQGYRPFDTRASIINVADSAPVTVTLRWTQNGPVLPPSRYALNTITPPGHVTSVAWTLLNGQDTSLSAALQIMRAQDVRDAIEAGRDYVAPAQNLTLADKTTIAFKTIGHVPRRNTNHRSKGRIPSQGWLPENQWQGRLAYSANPQTIGPASGILGNTNNKTIDREFPLHVSYDWGDTQRIRRWQGLMESRQVHTRDSFIEAQLDTVSFSARVLLPLIGAELWFQGEPGPEGSLARRKQIALSLLANWNGEMNEHLPEPLIYAAWVRALQNRLIQDELGPLASEFTHVEPLFIERAFRNVDGAAAWCDVQQSAPVETCVSMSELALEDALIWIEETWGANLETLRWGDAHQATHDHPTLKDVPLLSALANIRLSTSGGDHTLMRGRTLGTGPNPFYNVHGAGYRGVYDFADPDSSVFVIATGQSGHLLSRYYDDQAQLWRRGEYIPMSLDIDLARAAQVGTTWLRPAGD